MANKVRFGLEKVHIAFQDKEATTQPAWEDPIAIPGAVRWTPEVVGESTTFYADNNAYFVITANNGYTAELEMALIPNAVQARMFGWEIDTNGMLVEVANGIGEKFALMGQVQGDELNGRFVYWDCQASRPTKELTTKGETVEVNTDVLPVVISPVEVDGRTIVKGDLEYSAANATEYNAFFTEVYIPTFAPVTP